jgi:hypothetical protein
MNFAEFMIALSICTAIFGCYCATRKRNLAIPAKAFAGSRHDLPNIHMLLPGELDAWRKSEPHHHFFRIQDFRAQDVGLREMPGDPMQEIKIREAGIRETGPWKDKGISIGELERCIPWIPRDEKIVVCCPEDTGNSLLQRLKEMHTNRVIYLVDSCPSLPV